MKHLYFDDKTNDVYVLESGPGNTGLVARLGTESVTINKQICIAEDEDLNVALVVGTEKLVIQLCYAVELMVAMQAFMKEQHDVKVVQLVEAK